MIFSSRLVMFCYSFLLEVVVPTMPSYMVPQVVLGTTVAATILSLGVFIVTSILFLMCAMRLRHSPVLCGIGTILTLLLAEEAAFAFLTSGGIAFTALIFLLFS